MEIVGDLRELAGVVNMTGFAYQAEVMGHRNATADSFLTEHFPKTIHRLKIKTMREICRFVALDYYLFDFKPHPVCSEVVALANSHNGTRATWVDVLEPREKMSFLTNRFASTQKTKNAKKGATEEFYRKFVSKVRKGLGFEKKKEKAT